jgi:hypothetical protein
MWQSALRRRNPLPLRSRSRCFHLPKAGSTWDIIIVRHGITRGAQLLQNLTRLPEPFQKPVPVDTDTRHRAECCLAFQLEDGGTSVMSTFEPVDSHYPVGGMYEPGLQDAGAFVGWHFDDLVVARRCGGKNFRDPIGSAAHTAFIEFVAVTDDEDVWLHYCIDLFLGFAGPGQADIKRSNIGAAGFTFECHPHLVIQLSYEFLMWPRGGGRLSDIDDAIDQLIALTLRPGEVVSVSEVTFVALGACHTDIVLGLEPIVRKGAALYRCPTPSAAEITHRKSICSTQATADVNGQVGEGVPYLTLETSAMLYVGYVRLSEL